VSEGTAQKRRPAASPRLLLGWRECVALPDLGVDCLRAKVDSGARTSSLHVHGATEFRREDAEWIRFELAHGAREQLRHAAEAPIADRRVVTDSGGHRQLRIFIRTRLLLPSGEAWAIELNLTERRNMLFPMLLGRTALPRGCLVAPRRSYLLGRPLQDGSAPAQPDHRMPGAPGGDATP
jgi:hypothetical protein